MEYNIKKVKERLRREEFKDTKLIEFQFTDLLGNLCKFTRPFKVFLKNFDDDVDMGIGFDGSSITGMSAIEESDMVAKPDFSTLVKIPWKPDSARVICDIYDPVKQKPSGDDPRFILKRNLAEAKKKGFIFNVGPEMEFFLFKSNKESVVSDYSGYFRTSPTDAGEKIRDEIIGMMNDGIGKELGIEAEYSHHEVAPSQHEINFNYNDALKIADYSMTFRWIVKSIAEKNGMHATFMPKPMFGVNGSGMHIHQSLANEKGENLFFDSKDSDGGHLSEIAKQFIAGELKYAREICGILAQWVNSYKRLVPGYEAPVYVKWSQRNRSALIRVPMYAPGKEKSTRAEIRCADPAANPYLVYAVLLNAGLKGIDEKLELEEQASENLYELTQKEILNKKIVQLPGSLKEAIDEVRNSRLVKETLGESAYKKWIKLKDEEWDWYRTKVHSCEIERYLYL